MELDRIVITLIVFSGICLFISILTGYHFVTDFLNHLTLLLFLLLSLYTILSKLKNLKFIRIIFSLIIIFIIAIYSLKVIISKYERTLINDWTYGNIKIEKFFTKGTVGLSYSEYSLSKTKLNGLIKKEMSKNYELGEEIEPCEVIFYNKGEGKDLFLKLDNCNPLTPDWKGNLWK